VKSHGELPNCHPTYTKGSDLCCGLSFLNLPYALRSVKGAFVADAIQFQGAPTGSLYPLDLTLSATGATPLSRASLLIQPSNLIYMIVQSILRPAIEPFEYFSRITNPSPKIATSILYRLGGILWSWPWVRGIVMSICGGETPSYLIGQCDSRRIFFLQLIFLLKNYPAEQIRKCSVWETASTATIGIKLISPDP